MTLPTFPSTADPTRLQRVADLMARLGELPQRKVSAQNERLAELDVSSMILPPPAPTSTPTPSSASMPGTTTGN
jgi:hypothetical protein